MHALLEHMSLSRDVPLALTPMPFPLCDTHWPQTVQSSWPAGGPVRGLWAGGRVQGYHSWPHPLIRTGWPPQVRDACLAALVLQPLLALVCSA